MKKINIFIRLNLDISFDMNTQLNPGIGGTEYIFVLDSFLLSKREKGVTLYSNKKITGLDGMNFIQTDSIIDFFNQSIDADVVIIRDLELTEEISKFIRDNRIKTIVWAHNFQSYEMMKAIDENDYIKRNVCVGREQYEMLRGHNIFKKSDFVYNTIPFEQYIPSNLKIDKSVCYVGSLSEAKGFDIVAKNWKKVLKKVPNAQLYVIGNGQLYDKNQKLGKFKLAEQTFENKFIPYILDKKGKILPSVHFIGLLGGKQKIDFMKQMQLGVVNPRGWHETFCISAIEFEALKIPVVTISGYGYFDTISNGKSGFLFKRKKDFVRYIVKLLNQNTLNSKMGTAGYNFVRTKFDYNKVVNKWLEIIYGVINNKINICDYKYENPRSCKKLMLDIYRKSKKIIPFLPYPFNRDIKKKIFRIIKKS